MSQISPLAESKRLYLKKRLNIQYSFSAWFCSPFWILTAELQTPTKRNCPVTSALTRSAKTRDSTRCTARYLTSSPPVRDRCTSATSAPPHRRGDAAPATARALELWFTECGEAGRARTSALHHAPPPPPARSGSHRSQTHRGTNTTDGDLCGIAGRRRGANTRKGKRRERNGRERRAGRRGRAPAAILSFSRCKMTVPSHIWARWCL